MLWTRAAPLAPSLPTAVVWGTQGVPRGYTGGVPKHRPAVSLCGASGCDFPPEPFVNRCVLLLLQGEKGVRWFAGQGLALWSGVEGERRLKCVRWVAECLCLLVRSVACWDVLLQMLWPQTSLYASPPAPLPPPLPLLPLPDQGKEVPPLSSMLGPMIFIAQD